jgi:hypothetical protein
VLTVSPSFRLIEELLAASQKKSFEGISGIHTTKNCTAAVDAH